jgi:hypothetical protein
MLVQEAKVKNQARPEIMGAQKAGRAHGIPALPQPHTQSGTLILDLPQILPGDRFEPAAVTVTGEAFYGKLKAFANVTVREVPEIVNADGAWGDKPGEQRGFILDFGGMRSILRLLRSGSALTYVLVLPWQGTDFAQASLSPAYSGPFPMRTPEERGTHQFSLRGAESQKLYVQIAADLTLEEFLDQCMLETLVFPANLRASVADRPPFWTYPGPLQGETAMQGLSEALTSLAADLTAPLAPKLTLQSDAPGALQVPGGFAFLKAEKSAAASWAGSPGTAVPLRAGVPGTLPMRFPVPEDGKIWLLRSLKLSAAAGLAPWILDPVTPDPAGGTSALRINARLSAAQGFLCAQPVELHGVGLLLAAPQGAELSIELFADDGGRPVAAEALETRMLAVSGESAWQEALFEKPLLLEAGATAWIVVKAKSGSALWNVAPAAGSIAALYAEDGTAWQPFPRMLPAASGSPAAPGAKTPVAYPSAGLRLFRTPRPEENQSRVVVSHANGASLVEMALPVSDEAVEVEWLWPEAGRPQLAPAEGGRGIELGIRALSSGNLDISAATLFFAWKGP